MGNTATAEDGNGAPSLEEAVLDYNRLLSETCTVLSHFASRHEFIASHLAWLDANPASTKVSIIRGMLGQAQKQQEDSLKAQEPLLWRIGDLLWEIQSTPAAAQLYREGVLKVAGGLRLNGQDVDLYTLELRD